MTIILPSELESQIAERARAEGISLEAYVERVIREAAGQARKSDPPVPVWPGRPLGDLRRESLYEDVY